MLCQNVVLRRDVLHRGELAQYIRESIATPPLRLSPLYLRTFFVHTLAHTHIHTNTKHTYMYSALDTFGEECVKCNEESNCDEEFMACSGLPSSSSSETSSSSTNSSTSSCSESDERIWIETPSNNNNEDENDDDPVAKVTTMFETCINANDITCLLDTSCIETCLLDEYGYSTDCATCFGESVTCGVDEGCTLPW